MWTIQRTEEFSSWITGLDDDAKEAIYQSLLVLREIGPALGHPHVDTVKGSSFPNMKELRVQNKGRVFRIFSRSIPCGRLSSLLEGISAETRNSMT